VQAQVEVVAEAVEERAAARPNNAPNFIHGIQPAVPANLTKITAGSPSSLLSCSTGHMEA